MRTPYLVVVALTGVLVACANGGDDTGGNLSTGERDAGRDASPDGSTDVGSGGSKNSDGSTDDATGGTGSSGCEPQQHVCNGSCVGNTPETGCSGSTTCDPCPAAPKFASSICSPAGKCDFWCTPPYVASGNACTCLSGCCSDAECDAGTVCLLNKCQVCDTVSCAFECLDKKICPGSCVDNQCQCKCDAEKDGGQNDGGQQKDAGDQKG